MNTDSMNLNFLIRVYRCPSEVKVGGSDWDLPQFARRLIVFILMLVSSASAQSPEGVILLHG